MTSLEAAIDELRSNDRQWSAFCEDDHCVVLAPPGSGKTKLLTAKLAEELVAKIRPPHGAACITLTNPAAEELTRRLRSLGTHHSGLYVGTVHSFALSQIVMPYAKVAGMDEIANASLANSDEQAGAFRRAKLKVYGNEENERYLKSTMETARRLIPTDEELKPFGTRMRSLISEYEGFLRADELIDFDDLVSLAVQLVEENAFIRRALAAKYRSLYVDEYQDLAPGLDRLVRALCMHDVDVRLFAVGDPDQAIFGWTGSRPELLEELAESPLVTTVRLDVNYRCGTRIIASANLMLPVEKEIRGIREGGQVVATYCSSGIEEQRQLAATVIRSRLKQGTPAEEIAVIVSTNEECTLVADVLRQRQIECLVRSSEYRLTPATIFVESLAAWATLPVGTSGHTLSALLKTWRSILGPTYAREKDVHLIRLLRGFRARGASPGKDLLDNVLKIGLAQALEARPKSEDTQEVSRMTDALQAGALRTMVLSELGQRARPIGLVQVTTMTSSKGLEFDVVIMLALEEGVMPFWVTLNKPRALAEERRKFYVSLTRARKEVRLLFSGYYTTKNGYLRNEGPSRFLQELGLV